MDWNNIDLTNEYELDQDFLDGYSFGTLLLEVSCNLREINETTVCAHFLAELEIKVNSAKEIFEANLKNIVKQAQTERAQP